MTLEEKIVKNIWHERFDHEGGNFTAERYRENDELVIWANNGRTEIGHYFGMKGKSIDELVPVIKSDIENFLNGYVKCSECERLLKKEEIAGRYFAGSYCKGCWEGKWKAIEARETYD